MRRSPWLLLGLLFAAGAAFANGAVLRTDLSGDEEVPAVNTAAKGSFKLFIFPDRSTIQWELKYSGLSSDATQAHIHFGQTSVNGGISVFLCSNLGNGPAGTQTCPLREATLTGTITMASVIGPTTQGLPVGGLDALVDAIRSQLTYANVHSGNFLSGEIRGQIGTGRDDGHHRH